MIIALVSDIHSNREALAAVLSQARILGAQEILCLGDIVGYNADPDVCLEETMAACDLVIRGNHDKAVSGILGLDWFNSAARTAILWTQSHMQEGPREALRRLREGPLEAGDGSILLCHGTPYDEDEYLIDRNSIEESYRLLDSRYPKVRICFHGHTHLPVVVARMKQSAEPKVLPWSEKTELKPKGVYLINPGSVGQPRDGINLASFGILDTVRMVYRNIRVRYAVQETQRKILRAGLPPGLAHRLAQGK
jgi:predicted phosphodiesterase